MSRQSAQARSIRRWPRASVKYSRHSESFSGTTRFIPRYSTLGIRGVPSVVKDQGGAGGRHGPAEVHGDPGVPHLATLSWRVVVAVLALGPSGTGIVDLAAELADVLDHHGHAVGVA